MGPRSVSGAVGPAPDRPPVGGRRILPVRVPSRWRHFLVAVLVVAASVVPALVDAGVIGAGVATVIGSVVSGLAGLLHVSLPNRDPD